MPSVNLLGVQGVRRDVFGWYLENFLRKMGWEVFFSGIKYVPRLADFDTEIAENMAQTPYS
jgi:hypothetical protein